MLDLINLPATAQVVFGVASLYIVYLLSTTTTTWLRRRAFKRSKGCQPAVRVPSMDPIMGIDLFLRNIRALKDHTLLEVGTARFATLGAKTTRARVLGREIHGTIEPENLKTIQAVDFKKWGLGEGRKVGFHPLLGQGIFTSDGADWQHSRDMLRPNFVRSQIGDTVTFEKHISHLIAAIPRDGTTVDLSDLFFRLTIDSATEFLFGESTSSLTSSSADGFAAAFNNSQDFIANRARWGKWASLAPKNPRFEADRKFVHDFVDYYVDKGLSRRSQLLAETPDQKITDRYVFIDELVRQTPDRVRIRSELLNILLAGRDTTASLLTNVWHVLSRRPDIWNKLQSEVSSHLHGNQPTFEQLKDLKYLQSILSESLRLHPVVPLNSREAQVDTTLPRGGGPDGEAPVFIPKGGVVAWNVYAMHRREDIYGADAEVFRPERWLDGEKPLRPGWGYLPFNGGARVCLGQQFALTEASYATARLCQAFSGIESRDGEEWREFLTLTCVSLNGAKVGLTPREP